MKSPIHIQGALAKVELTRGFEAIIDAGDVPIVQGHKWAVLTTPTGHVYAARTASKKTVLMHRILLNAPRGLQVDHVDGNGLNNRRGNIRLATPALNQANKAVDPRNKLGIKGVSKKNNRFSATITPNGKKIHLGRYDTTAEAAAAYRGAAAALWGNYRKK